MSLINHSTFPVPDSSQQIKRERHATSSQVLGSAGGHRQHKGHLRPLLSTLAPYSKDRLVCPEGPFGTAAEQHAGGSSLALERPGQNPKVVEKICLKFLPADRTYSPTGSYRNWSSSSQLQKGQ